LRALPRVGASILELSHRSDAFEAVAREAETNLRELLEIPPTHRVLFLQGGASLQFSMAPMNLIGGTSEPAAHVLTGSWSAKAAAEARKQGPIAIAWDGRASGYTTVPLLDEVGVPDGAPYLHVTSNETIQGVQFPPGFEPAAGPPLVCDASSDVLSRPLPLERYDVLYAGAQKNAGAAGLTIVLVSEHALSRIPEGLPTMLDYRTYSEHASLYNTPPVFAIDVLMLVTRWLRDEIGGLDKMWDRNREKAALLYEAIDASDGFYVGHAAPAARSSMNVTFRLPSPELEEAFLAEADRRRLIELRGHRSVGGIRASIYNAMPLDGVRALRELMDEFHAER
jgi:phosphoserine aminotransferase